MVLINALLFYVKNLCAVSNGTVSTTQDSLPASHKHTSDYIHMDQATSQNFAFFSLSAASQKGGVLIKLYSNILKMHIFSSIIVFFTY